MRWAVLVVLYGCGFSRNLSGDVPSDDVPVDAPIDSIDAMTTPPTMPVVRMIDIVDAKVVGGPHANFPMLVTAGITGVHPMAFDVYFSLDAAGTTRLAHEVERYVPGEYVAWVKVPMLTPATQFYLHYGNPAITTSQENRAGVWNANNWAGVWHLATIEDATVQNTTTNTGTTSAGGKIGTARAFDGTTNSLDAGSAGIVDNVFAGGGTFEAWFIPTGWGQNDFGRIFDKGPSFTIAMMCHATQQASFYFGRTFTGSPGNWCTPVDSLTLNTWTHVAVTYNSDAAGNVPTIYLNGVVQTLTTVSTANGATTSDASGNLTIGDRDTGARAFAGRLDELRFSTTTRSAGWITTTYENQRDPSTFFTILAL